MPYIADASRPEYQNAIEFLVSHLRTKRDAGINVNGDMNYIITALIISLYAEEGFKNYESLSNGVKALECAKLEFYRRYVAPYEDTKIADPKNGDVLPLANKKRQEDKLLEIV